MDRPKPVVPQSHYLRWLLVSIRILVPSITWLSKHSLHRLITPEGRTSTRRAIGQCSPLSSSSNAEDDNSYYDAFAQIKDQINSLHFIFETFFMITMPGKPSGITNALTGNPMFFSYNTRIYSREYTACPCKHFKAYPILLGNDFVLFYWWISQPSRLGMTI